MPIRKRRLPTALARLVDELRARHPVRIRAHRGTALDEPAHLRPGRLQVLLEERSGAPLQGRGVLEPAERRGRRYGRQLGHEPPALLPQPWERVEQAGAHQLELALGERYEAAVTGVHALLAASSHASRRSRRSFATCSIFSGSCFSRASSSSRWQKEEIDSRFAATCPCERSSVWRSSVMIASARRSLSFIDVRSPLRSAVAAWIRKRLAPS